jgi:hypothetical protein
MNSDEKPNQRARVSAQWVVPFLAAMALIFGAVAFVTYSRVDRLVKNGATARGTVVENVGGTSTGTRGNSKVYYPVVRFQTESGQSFEEQLNMGSNPPAHQVGDVVEVLYDKSNPKDWTIRNALEMYFLPGMFGFFATLLTIAAGIVAYYTHKRKPKPGPWG